MRKYTESDKPLISILMAIYEPRMDWLAEQLRSLNEQTYPNLRLYVRDDCSSTVGLDQIEAILREYITAMPWTLVRNESNLGSKATFQRLTEEVEGTYFAYCDQDDIWLPEKLEILEQELAGCDATLACSDMFIIDGTGRQIADSITKVRRRHRFQSGTGLAKDLLVHNFASGCTILVRSQLAKEAVPFCPYMHHDHYLALWCAQKGEVRSVAQPLIRYRIYGENQTGRLAKVWDRASYWEDRIEGERLCAQWLMENFPGDETVREALEEELVWLEARTRNWNHCGGKKIVWEHRHLSWLCSVAEIVIADLPEPLFKLVLKAWKHFLL